jgi:hypothetical protein
MDWHRYVTSYYRRDLSRFLEAFGNRPGEDLFGCLPCALPNLRTAVAQADLSDREAFVANLTLEAVLTAGVHCYDFAHYTSYVDSVGLRIYLQDHGLNRMTRPHQLLSLLSDTPTNTDLVRSCVASLAPAWANAYERLFGPGSGAKIIKGLAVDPDLGRAPDQTPLPLVAALRDALAEVATALGGPTR